MAKSIKSGPGPAGSPGALDTPTDLSGQATRAIADALNGLLADAFALYLKTKNFHWHMSGPHFRDYHLMLDEQSDQIFATTDPLAERVRNIWRGPGRRRSPIPPLRVNLFDPGAVATKLRGMAMPGEDPASIAQPADVGAGDRRALPARTRRATARSSARGGCRCRGHDVRDAVA